MRYLNPFFGTQAPVVVPAPVPVDDGQAITLRDSPSNDFINEQMQKKREIEMQRAMQMEKLKSLNSPLPTGRPMGLRPQISAPRPPGVPNIARSPAPAPPLNLQDLTKPKSSEPAPPVKEAVPKPSKKKKAAVVPQPAVAKQTKPKSSGSAASMLSRMFAGGDSKSTDTSSAGGGGPTIADMQKQEKHAEPQEERVPTIREIQQQQKQQEQAKTPTIKELQQQQQEEEQAPVSTPSRRIRQVLPLGDDDYVAPPTSTSSKSDDLGARKWGVDLSRIV